MRSVRAMILIATLLSGCGSTPPVVAAASPTASASPRPNEAPPIRGSGSIADLAPDDPYPASATFVRTSGRSQRLAAAPACQGRRGLRLLAVMATGPSDDREVLRLAEMSICPDRLTTPRLHVADASWARTARGGFAAVRRTDKLTDEAVLYRAAKEVPLRAADGYSTNIPVPFDDGGVAYAVATDRGMRVDLRDSAGTSRTLLTSGSSVYGFDYTPSGRRFAALERVGVPGASAGSRLTVADSDGVQRHLLGRPFAASLLVIDEQTAVVGDITDTPGAASVLVDLTTGRMRPLATGLFAVAHDVVGRRLLMRDVVGSLSWLSLATGDVVPLGAAAQWRVVGGDFVR